MDERRSEWVRKGYQNHPELREVRAKQLRETIKKHPDKFPWNKGRINLPDSLTEEDVIEAYLETRSVHKAARLLCISMHKVWRICSKAGIMRDSSTAQRERMQNPDERGNVKMEEYPEGEEHWNWKGGKNRHSRDGYVYMTSGPNLGRAVHRIKMEQFIGRILNKGEIVHHRNKTRDDNTFPITDEMLALSLTEKEKLARLGIGNLQLLTNHEHMILHHLENNPEFAELLLERILPVRKRFTI